jgi:hypothetical protein
VTPVATLEHALSAAIAELSADRSLTVLDLAAAGSVAFQIRLDSLGVPRVQESPAAGIGSVEAGSGTFILAEADPEVPLADAILARYGPHVRAAIRVRSGADIRSALADVIAGSAIRQDYELLLARADPADSRIRLSAARLFQVGARQGAVAELTVRSECTDESGTVFAVVAREGRTPRLLSADSVRLVPGRHRTRAELVQPGVVRFTEPVGVTADQRTLTELMAAVPRSLNAVGRAHLICAVEITGLAARVAARLYRIEKLIEAMRRQMSAHDQLKVGIIGYGAHRFQHRRDDDRVVVTDWLSKPEDAAKSLGKLGAAKPGRDPAAQVEDMLAEVVRQFELDRESRLQALVIFGDRPPYPANLTDLISACPHHRDWEELLATLEKRGCRLAAIRDKPSAPGAGAWHRLGGSRPVFPLDTFDPDQVGRQIGFIVPSLLHIPFPLPDAEPRTDPLMAEIR